MNTRIKEIMNDLDISVQQLADRIGVSRQTIEFYISGKIKPGTRVLNIMCKELCVNIRYLTTGEGRKYDELRIARLEQNKKILKIIAGIKIDNNITQKKIEQELGFPQGIFKDLKKGTFTLSDDKIKKLERKYKVSML